MKTILLLALLAVADTLATAATPAYSTVPDDSQPAFRVSLKYNSEVQRYEAYAQANFTQAAFPLGPSQITLVVPGQVADQSFNIVSATAQWQDYSSVYAPTVTPGLDFHGIHSMGKPIDVQADNPFMLFAFSLKEGYVEGVRLYINGQDPSSKQAGMMGGDFVNTMQNHKSVEFYREGLNERDLAQLTTKTTEPGEPTITVHPNPISGDVLTVTARQFAPGEKLSLRLLSVTGVEFARIEESVERLVNYRLRIPHQLAGSAYLYAERATPVSGPRSFCQKLIILN
ncbi:MAG: hypothetical protein LH609_15645 [Rudanella sp.]|nr:hypothetical protein [Rudanella sp.]